MVTLPGRIGRLDEDGTGSVHLEGKITLEREVLAVHPRGLLEVQHAVRSRYGIRLAGVDVEVLADHLLLDGAAEQFGIGQVPCMGTFNHVHGKVFGLLGIGSPPLGCTHVLPRDLGIRIQIEVSALGVEAGVGREHLGIELPGGILVGEVGGGNVVIPVVGSVYGKVVCALVLGGGTSHGRIGRHVEDEVVLERERRRDALESEDTHIVVGLDGIQVLDGVVLEADVTYGGGLVNPEERPHTVHDSVVEDVQFGDGGSLPHVDDVTAVVVGVDVEDVAAVEGQLTQVHGLVPLIEKALAVLAYDTVLEGDGLDLGSGFGKVLLVLMELDHKAVGLLFAGQVKVLEMECTLGEG